MGGGTRSLSYQPFKVKASPRFKDLERPQIGERLDFGMIVRMQVDRCLMAAGDDYTFAQHVKALEALIPATDITEEYLEEALACTMEFEYSTPVTVCGVPIDEEIIKGTSETVTEVDWHGRFQAAINLFTSMGITWRRRPTTAA